MGKEPLALDQQGELANHAWVGVDEVGLLQWQPMQGFLRMGYLRVYNMVQAPRAFWAFFIPEPLGGLSFVIKMDPPAPFYILIQH